MKKHRCALHQPQQLKQELQVVDANKHACSVGNALGFLRSVGFSVIMDNELQKLVLKAAAAATSRLQKKGKPIFNDVTWVRGRVKKDHDGRVVLSVGTKQRLQATFGHQPAEELSAVWRHVQHLMEHVLEQQDSAEPKLEVKPPFILGNKPGSRPVRAQALHTDMKPGDMHSFIAIVPMEEDTYMRVVPASHHAISIWAHQRRIATEAEATGVEMVDTHSTAASREIVAGTTRAGQDRVGRVETHHQDTDGTMGAARSGKTGCPKTGCLKGAEDPSNAKDNTPVSEGGGTSYSDDLEPEQIEPEGDAPEGSGPKVGKGEDTGDIEDACSSSSDAEELPLDDSDGLDDDTMARLGELEKVLQVFPVYSVQRLLMQPGQVILLHGNTVHAGDVGKEGEEGKQWTPRIHCYVQANIVFNATHPIAALPESIRCKLGG